MLNEDFNEVADSLAKQVSTSRTERVFFGNLVTELREVYRRLEELEGRVEEQVDTQDPEPEKSKKTTKKKATKKTASKS